jgi:hypothetical protein
VEAKRSEAGTEKPRCKVHNILLFSIFQRTLFLLFSKMSFGTNIVSAKLFNGINKFPDIYTLNGTTAAIVNRITTNTITIPLVLATTQTGDITFTFEGVDQYDAYIVFVDKVAGDTLNLTQLSDLSYTFNYAPVLVDGEAVAVEDRFEIQFLPSEYTVTLPAVTGATLNPATASNAVKTGHDFEFTITLDADYDESTSVVTITREGGDAETITPTDGKYTIPNVRSAIAVSITGIVLNPERIVTLPVVTGATLNPATTSNAVSLLFLLWKNTPLR